MHVITVDDEPLMLYALSKAVKASPDITSIAEFTSCEDALDWVKEHPAEIAFLDIDMRGMGGLALAQKIMDLHPDCKIVFCTGYEQYAVAAIKLRVSGYLMKPVSAEDVQEEIDYIKGKNPKEKTLTITCFGNFEVYLRREKLTFKRRKTKELLAFLVDRKGAGVTVKEISARLWSDNRKDDKYPAYVRQLIFDLRQTLAACDMDHIIVQNNYDYSLDTQKIDCDYYSYLETGKPEFRGEYMTQYSWAEETCGLLWK